ncbi:gluconokinase [Inquilinus sp. KBS0705]|nr:gluconokinase [Inquilinus sp. KBS0705]
MQNYFVGIDLGTGSTKAVAVDVTGKVLYTAQKHYPTLNPKPGHSVQNPCLIWDAFVYCLNQITQKLSNAPAAVSFSAAMHSIMPVNEAGEPLADAILWSDSRSGDIAQSIRDSTQGEDIYHHTGTAIYAMSPLCKLVWLHVNSKDLFDSAYKFISVKEYIWYRLFNCFEVDYSIASATGLFDVVALQWYLPACKLAAIDAGRLSTPVNTDHKRFLPAVNPLLPGITTQTAFVIGASDGCCANLGGNAVRNGIAALTIGTSGAVRVGSDKPIYNYKAMTFNYLLNAKTFICGGAVNNGGAAADWLIKSFLKITNVTPETYEQVFAEIYSVAAGSNGLMFLPYLYAERAPIWDAKSSGAFVNINFSHQQQHFLRAALEGICFALWDVLKAVEDSSSLVEEVVISGGFISSPVWVQLLADVLGKKLVVMQSEDASAIGTIYLAMEALGINYKTIQDKDAQDKVTIYPDMAKHDHYLQLFPVYKKLYNDLKDSMHMLHTLNH